MKPNKDMFCPQGFLNSLGCHLVALDVQFWYVKSSIHFKLLSFTLVVEAPTRVSVQYLEVGVLTPGSITVVTTYL